MIIVFGVSGAGKTTVGKLLARELGWSFVEADDFHPAANIEKMRNGHPLTDEDRWPWLDCLRKQIEQLRSAGENAVLACSALKRAYRDRLRVSDEVKFVFVRGDYALVEKQLGSRCQQHQNPSRKRTKHQHYESSDERSRRSTQISKRVRSCKTCKAGERVDRSHNDCRLGVAEDFRRNRPEH